MLRHIILPLAAVFCGASCCLNAAENDTLEKMFSNISIFRKGDVQKKNDRANTKSVRYLGPQQLFFTVSVLNPAGRDITEGAASAELKQAFAQAVETQKQLRKGLKEEKTETLSLRCLAGKKLTGIYTVLTYTDNNLPYHICIFMTGYRGNLLKVEFAPAVPGDFRCFWSCGTAWGVFSRSANESLLEVLGGTLNLREMKIDELVHSVERILRAGERVRVE